MADIIDENRLLSLEKKKAKAIDLARKQGVFNALEYYFFRVVSWDSCDAVSRHNAIAKSTVTKNYKYLKSNQGLYRSCFFSLEENTFSLSAEFADSTEIGIVRVFWNNEEVLTANCKRLESYFHFQLQADGPNVSKLKLKKEWVSCVQQFHRVCEKVIDEEERKAQEQELFNLSNDFDLGDFE